MTGEKTIKSLVSNKLDDVVTWTSWRTVASKTKKGKESKNKKPKSSQGTVADCIKELIEVDIMKKKNTIDKSKLKSKRLVKSKKGKATKPELQFSFVKHFFSQSYQYKQYAQCIKALKPGEAVCTQDFSNPIDCTPQEEVKAARYGGSLQVTCHPSVIYAKVNEKTTIKVSIIHLSDNTQNNAKMVSYISTDCINYVLEKYPETTWVKFYFWSDGCPLQYKCKTSFHYLKKIRNVEVERNFFASEHGKK